MNTRFRHGRNRRGELCGTLVTVREGDTIYFGIAKCNLKCDSFSKADGRERAIDKAYIAYDNRDKFRNPIVKDGLTLHKSGLLGKCNVDNIPALLDYFRDASNFLRIK